MIEDIYQFARDRYFVGEMVEASFTENSWCECHVLQVIEPMEAQIKAHAKENSRSVFFFQNINYKKLGNFENDYITPGEKKKKFSEYLDDQNFFVS